MTAPHATHPLSLLTFQVLITYGQKSNAELVLLYGFVIDRNRFDEVELRVSLASDDPRYDDKAAFLRSVGLTPEQAFPLLIDRYSNELVQFLRLCCATPADGPLGAIRFNDPISLANEVAVYEALVEGCNVALAQYPETEEEDAKLMGNAQMFAVLSRRQRMAVKLRRNEKRILLRTIRVCDAEIAELEGALARR
jgi:histone-lysine N-methyltransferase SETD3